MNSHYHVKRLVEKLTVLTCNDCKIKLYAPQRYLEVYYDDEPYGVFCPHCGMRILEEDSKKISEEGKRLLNFSAMTIPKIMNELQSP